MASETAAQESTSPHAQNAAGAAFAADAPGWRSTEDDEDLGPICWRCKGTKKSIVKVSVDPNENEANTADAAGNDDDNNDAKTSPQEDGEADAGEKNKKKNKKKGKKKLVEVTCRVCEGAGRIKKKRKEVLHANQAGKTSSRKRKVPDDWVIPGPASKGGVEPEAGEEVCHLLGHWRIFQRIGGHRWSTDDLVTAWVAGRAWREAQKSVAEPQQQPAHCLDLGCGIGSVLMMVAWQFTEARCLGVEAQVRSATMARRSIEFNGCADRCQVVQGDIREYADFDKAAPEGKFDLVTGTPPYFPVNYTEGTGVATPGLGGLPSCEQSAPARYEFRGGVEAYCAAARPRLRSRDSRFVVCEGLLGANHSRVLKGASENGLEILQKVSVHGRDDKPALFAVYVMRLADEGGADSPPTQEESLIIRYKGGKRSEAYVSLMASLGIPP
ncbi:HemK methyltransferase family member 1 [Hondaea fermentalgiana]|uniref:HemK methyltransferase family member 1 n=1 Tax=Hondaea fermentalgiana TaxID=2315210 RepID=A0A2R5GYI8_9STRA|nr:HemK methyltransferase family member 1 [Hondaea fermentalgiana]|eukprot:GBG34878.1 HemK methyltransferase family member 1 [Hondaea fermentalgiana]